MELHDKLSNGIFIHDIKFLAVHFPSIFNPRIEDNIKCRRKIQNK